MATTPPKSAARCGIRLCALTLTAALAGVHANAEYHVAAYENTPGFDEIMNDDANTAHGAIPTNSPLTPAFALSTNRCVSEILADELDAALTSCNKAIRKIPKGMLSIGAVSVRERNATRSGLLSNRGVVHALQGRLEEAEADFTLALKLSDENTNARKNLSYLQNLKLSQR